MKLRNIYKGLKDQLPLTRLIRNLWSGNVFGGFHIRSHENADGRAKVKYNTKATANFEQLILDRRIIHYGKVK